MHGKVKFSLIIVMCIIALISTVLPYSFASGGPVTAVQFAFNAQQSSTIATCTLSSPVAKGDTLLATLDAAFIDRTTLHISDSLGNAWTNFTIALNSASTWAWSFQARNIAHGGSSDIINFTYTDISGRGTYTQTCAEFLGNENFSQITGIGTLTGIGCNSCLITMVNTNTSVPPALPHSVNYVAGWTEISTNPPAVFNLAYLGFATPFVNPETGSGNVETISGTSAGIVAFHAENNQPIGIFNNGTGALITCSPSCILSPAFVLTYSSICLGGACAPVTSTITGWLIPAFGNGTPANTSWLLGMIVLLLPVGLIDTYFVASSPNISQQVLVFLNLGGLATGSLMGVMIGALPSAFAFIIPVVFVLYLWKGR